MATPNDPADESGIATRTAQRLGLEHEVIPLERQSLPPMEERVSAFGEPFPCSSAIGLVGVSILSRSKSGPSVAIQIPVMLDHLVH